ncbi:MAG: hypothetical protein KAV87_05845 [Desulfobacteraceae bacterium]|nr:hypothetical protein [Desulfobacteraceae bacterium]
MCTDNHKTPNDYSADTGSPESSGRTLDLLKKVQVKAIDPKSICKADRQLMVGHLMAEGYSTADMAEIFLVTDRTIERDKNAIREANALKSDPELAEIMAGRLVFEADLAIQGIRKAARDKKAFPAVRIDAHHRCYQILDGLVQRLQSLGYLPTATQKVAADVTHHAAEVPDFSEMRLVVEDLKKIAPQEAENLNQLEARIVKAELADNIVEVSSTIQTKGNENEESK